MAAASKNIVYVIGAGLSAGLQFPTIHSLLPALWPRLIEAGIANEIAEVIRFHHPDFNAARQETFPTIEALLSEMKANADLFHSTRPAVGNFTSERLESRRADLLQAIAEWFHELKVAALKRPPVWLHTLVSSMKEENATVISFNWDLVLDELLFGQDLEKASYGLDRRRKGVRLLKPHGSLNWYQAVTAGPLKETKKFSLGGTGMNQVYAFRPLRAPKSTKGRNYMPLIVPPVFTKQFEGPLFQRLWQESVRALSSASEVRFLGYSLADADYHARFVLRCGFHNQEHGELTAAGKRSPPTGRAKVVIVDLAEEPFVRIRKVVGWECETHRKTIAEWIEHRDLTP